MTSTPQTFTPPNLLRKKVTGGGPISQEMLDRAERALESLSAEFDDLMAGEVAKLVNLYATGLNDPAKRLDVAKQIYDVAHDLRGQAGTFDYSLVTRIGSSLCCFTSDLDSCDDRRMELIRLHIDSMQLVLKLSLRGDGGAAGAEIAGGLEKAVQKFRS